MDLCVAESIQTTSTRSTLLVGQGAAEASIGGGTSKGQGIPDGGSRRGNNILKQENLGQGLQSSIGGRMRSRQYTGDHIHCVHGAGHRRCNKLQGWRHIQGIQGWELGQSLQGGAEGMWRSSNQCCTDCLRSQASAPNTQQREQPRKTQTQHCKSNYVSEPRLSTSWPHL
eukprot:477536-Amphidinium_carterae.1